MTIGLTVFAILLAAGGVSGTADRFTPSSARWLAWDRPTSNYLSLAGDWSVTTVEGNRNDLWQEPRVFGATVILPEIDPLLPDARQVPRARDISVNWCRLEFRLSGEMIVQGRICLYGETWGIHAPECSPSTQEYIDNPYRRPRHASLERRPGTTSILS